MGEGKEQFPLALITNAPVEWCEHVDPSEVRISLEDDMYMPMIISATKNSAA
jgi:F420-0:gamma-glutamyl ligase